SVAVVQEGRVAVSGSDLPRAERLRSVGRLSPWVAYPTWDPGQEDFHLRRVWADLLAREGAALAPPGRDEAAGGCSRLAVRAAEALARGDGYCACPPCSWPSTWSVIAGQVSQQEPCYLYDLACHLALASTLPGKGGEADRAVAALRGCGAAGFDNIPKLR